MSDQFPSIGRIVHYVGTNGKHYPADICAVRRKNMVDLFVKDSTRRVAEFEYEVLYSTGHEPGTWHWPEYVPAREDPA
jgi:hypothetical protein